MASAVRRSAQRLRAEVSGIAHGSFDGRLGGKPVGREGPGAARVEPGVTGVQGKVWLTDGRRSELPGRLPDGPAAVLGPGGYGMFLAIHEFPPVPPGLAALIGIAAGALQGYFGGKTDLFVQRAMMLAERLRLNRRLESFNLFNHANVLGFNGVWGNGATPAPGFGQPLSGTQSRTAKSIGSSGRQRPSQ